LEIAPSAAPRDLTWYATFDSLPVNQVAADWALYQDSSGGDHWNSTNHIDAAGRRTVTFRGYEVRDVIADSILARGERAEPAVIVSTDVGSIGVAVDKFWQNFPKALRWRGGALEVGVFPTECHAGFELQGGEQKRHTAWLTFGNSEAVLETLRARQRPVVAWVDPAWVESSGAIPSFTTAARSEAGDLHSYLNSIIDGPHAFIQSRETIDEYGWRNFGDLYADHEAMGWKGACPMIAHYNNQYDFIYAAAHAFARSGDSRWFELMVDAARHTIDIDIYHTDRDRPAYNHGLFWHTDHYRDAATCTHRSYSRANGNGRDYGGGPGNEHNYTSGLLLYYYLTGDVEARCAVLELADWVIAMDDGAQTVFALLTDRPTGRASATTTMDYHKPGRGAGNSVNALLDAYMLSGVRSYLRKAEELVGRCVHPRDDVATLRLDDPEHRWSYLVFLQVLGRYLELKAEYGEFDYWFYFARDSLLHYVEWMLENEAPYKEVLHKVEIPTETWAAQDIRKCHVFHLAARCSSGHRRVAYAERAEFFFRRCLTDLHSFETAYLTRPRVILSVFGPIHAFFLERGYGGDTESAFTRDHSHTFGEPEIFVPQRAYLGRAVRDRLRATGRELRRLVLAGLPSSRAPRSPRDD
jgi:hypothetical protein